MNLDVTCVWMEKQFSLNRTAQVIDLTYGRARIIVFENPYTILDNW